MSAARVLVAARGQEYETKRPVRNEPLKSAYIGERNAHTHTSTMSMMTIHPDADCCDEDESETAVVTVTELSGKWHKVKNCTLR